MRTPLLAAAALLSAATPTTALADTLIDHANGIQVDARGRLQHFDGLVIGNDGRVVRLLTKGDVRPSRIDARIDAGGRTLLPGLIDAHGHVMGLGFGALQLDLTGTTSLGELQQRLKAYAAAHPSGWVVGRGWNQELWPDKRFPTAADLDVIVPGRPVWLERVDGHASVANSAAMAAAGVTAATKAPSGGRIENGLFVDAARDLVESKVPPPSPTERDRALREAQAILLSNGLTAVADMGTTPEDWATMRRLGEAGGLKVRIISYAAGPASLPAISGGKPAGWLYDGRLRLAGIKLYADGALGSRGAWLKAAYADRPDTKGLRFLTDAELDQQAGDAAAMGFQVAVHAIGDAANAQVIGAYERLTAKYGAKRRWRIEHAQIIDPADFRRLKPAGLIASMQPTHQTSDRTMAEARLGPDRLKGAYAWQTIARLGVPLAFGSDFPVESPNPFPGLSAAISRQDPAGQPPGGWRPQERVSFAQALAGFTRGAAFAGFAEDRIGSLEPGKYADFILVDRDVSKVAPGALAQTQVLETWAGGKKVWARETSAAAAPVR